ncbi:dTDP-4-dehydrorhamnose 3,5-epimerase [Rhodobium orientis]|uniref:dTDP-4-dehydrorhamnose 3,5-epimerase n=1 Tax=Rhodobium orientis TaxID=34017 RepID=A0A327JJT7_9HYPH|nr:dTDP-4-dehydrorhamnose 3,5-epimerase [Rhodobium orientis]MBB4305333.1 dTDP-4-dehydrorhamnose 3,5-epimerase [Rhodobium orientis]MBK5949928.1 dTDP-4-dehydrorhamnose 3,5-epimerase [Rhodobium orientis]RAI25543.1 dTDP-4-dehydrorhamnose 3,5-epimerase [Rhodobium orientis]
MPAATPLALDGALLIEPKKFGDARGFFSEVFNARDWAEIGISGPFVQDNHSLSGEKGVIRGMHFQVPPHAQGKLVRVVAGAILDVIVDIRKGSPTYGRHDAIELSAENWRQLWVPPGFAHGFCTLAENTEVLYKVDDYYSPECDKGLAFDDPALAIDWPVDLDAAILSAKDRTHPLLADLPDYFSYGA